jgi:putative intracellular protease/amidase
MSHKVRLWTVRVGAIQDSASTRLTAYCHDDSMWSMTTSTVHVAVYDTLTDSEVGHLLVELRTGRFTGTPFDVVTVAETREPITTMGGLRILPDILLADLEPADSCLLVLPGALMWDTGGGDAFAAAAARFLDAGVLVAAICGGTLGLARAGLLDDRAHTSAAADYLAATGYAGGDRYVDQRAVIDGNLVTAGPQSPVQFARAVLQRMGLASDSTLDAYEGVFHRADPAAFPVLMQASASA